MRSQACSPAIALSRGHKPPRHRGRSGWASDGHLSLAASRNRKRTVRATKFLAPDASLTSGGFADHEAQDSRLTDRNRPLCRLAGFWEAKGRFQGNRSFTSPALKVISWSTAAEMADRLHLGSRKRPVSGKEGSMSIARRLNCRNIPIGPHCRQRLRAAKPSSFAHIRHGHQRMRRVLFVPRGSRTPDAWRRAGGHRRVAADLCA